MTVDLTGFAPDIMTAKLDGSLKPGAKVVVSVKLPDGHDVNARFVAK